MKTTVLTFALALATMPLTFAKTQTPATGAAETKPAATAKVTKKHHKRVVKKTVKTPAASAMPVPVKQ